jgi:hypothetical protein
MLTVSLQTSWRTFAAHAMEAQRCSLILNPFASASCKSSATRTCGCAEIDAVRATIASEWDALRRELAEGRHRQLQAGLSSGHRVLHRFCGSDLDCGTP